AGNGYDERVVGRTAFCLKDLNDGGRIQRVGAEAVHGFGRKGDHVTRTNEGCRFFGYFRTYRFQGYWLERLNVMVGPTPRVACRFPLIHFPRSRLRSVRRRYRYGARARRHPAHPTRAALRARRYNRG